MNRIWMLFAFSLSAFLLGLGLVWVNIELVDISYDIEKLQTTLKKEEELNSKLKVEKMNLISSYRLRDKAAEFGLRPPESNQIRELSEPGEQD